MREVIVASCHDFMPIEAEPDGGGRSGVPCGTPSPIDGRGALYYAPRVFHSGVPLTTNSGYRPPRMRRRLLTNMSSITLC